MNCFVHSRFARLTLMSALLVSALTAPCATSFAHGGEDHGDKKAPAVSTGPGMVVQTARAGDVELVIKHPPIEPDKEIAARVLVTRYATNEPIGNAKITLTLAATAGGAPVDVVAAPAEATPGMYEAKLPPLPTGEYTLAARFEAAGKSETVEYGALPVAPLHGAAPGTVTSWARTALIGLGLLIVFGLAGLVVYRAAQAAQRDRLKGQTAATV